MANGPAADPGKTVCIVAILSACLAACGDEAAAPVAELAPDANALPADEEILAKVFDSDYFVPDDFLVDARADTPGSYTLYHVKDTSLSYELCTDDYSQALEWEAADNQSRSVNGALAGSLENDQYFEFVRDLSFGDDIGNIPSLTSPGFARIFKCSNVDRDGVDRNLRDGYAGRLNARPLSRESIRRFSEYLWQFSFFPTAHKKVVRSTSIETEQAFQQSLILALTGGTDSRGCQNIEVFDWLFSVDKSSGEISKRFTPRRILSARQHNGLPETC